ncbi:MAG: Rrf2 family transcriptional regulator [Defluviitaleaceae bacterium]|nr:Rrf2 family transcriptional regulator [Defluviitaleaceae bacterium]
MKISTKGRYGLRAVVDIAHQSKINGQKCVSIKSVAERQGLSENYLEQIISPLKKARVLTSVRGSGGGYLLAKAPREFTVGDILRVLEGPLAPADCVLDDAAACAESDCGTCSTKTVWSTLFDSINNVVDNITIEDLMNDTKLV